MNEYGLQLGWKTVVKDSRNGIPEYSQGDKSYKKPEHSTDFFWPGGLIAGSTN